MAAGNYTMRGKFAHVRQGPREARLQDKRITSPSTSISAAEQTVSLLPAASRDADAPACSTFSGKGPALDALREPALPEIDSRCGVLTRTLMEASPETGAAATHPPRADPLSIRISNATQNRGDAISSGGQASVAPGAQGKLCAQAAERILALTETSGLRTVDDALARIDEIATLFSEAKDPRGICPVTYRVITLRARDGVEEHHFEHEDWARALVVQFAERFLENLRAHMTGHEVSPAWKTYFDRADDANVSVAGVLGSGIFAHLVDDLPLTLAEIHSQPEQSEDFTKFGILLLDVYPDLVKDVARYYEADVTPLLSGFAPGKVIDHLWGDGSTTALLFQSIRQKAWIMGQRLQKDCTSEIARFEMEQSLAVLQFALRGFT